MKFKIKAKDAGSRLDKLLVEKLDNKSRGQVQAMIEAGAVLVNGKNLSNHYALKLG
jgi:23S rRNA pseudouridine1911/1915/1917 synthase